MKIDKDNRTMLIFLAIVVGIVLANNSGLFSINLQTSDIQFYNKPIVLPFTVSNFTSPTVEAYFNDVRLYDVLTYEENETRVNNTIDPTTNQSVNTLYSVLVNKTRNQSIGYTKSFSNGTYNVRFENIYSEGLIKIKVSEGNNSETKSVEVRQAFVDISDNVPNLVDRSKIWTIEIDTKNPQGDALEADSVDVDVYDPLNVKTTIFLEKAGSKFTKQFSYVTAGNYQFKIHARKEGYVTKEVTRITSVTKSEGIHPIVYIWVAATAIWLLLFGIKMLRRFVK